MAAIPRVSWSDFERQLGAASRGSHLPLSGSFELTLRCDFACVHCFQQGSRAQRELSAERWCALVDEVARAGCLWLTLTGGEPLLHPGFAAIYERAVRAGMLVTIFSNGSTLSKQAVERLRHLPPRTLEVTLYGFSAATYRRVTGRSENFRRAVDGVRRAVQAGLAVQIKTMVFEETVRDFEAIRAFAEELGQSFRFDTLVHRTLGHSAAPARHRLVPAQVVAFEARQPEAARNLDRAATMRPGRNIYHCGAGKQAFAIAPDGALQPCSLVRSPRFPLSPGGFEEAWHELGQSVKGRWAKGSRCGSCAVRALCSTCPGIAQVEGGQSEAPVDYLCEIAHLRAKARGAVESPGALARPNIVR